MSTNTRRVGTLAALVSAAALITPAFANALPTGSLGSADPDAGFTCSATSTEAATDGWGIPFTDEKDHVATYSAEAVIDKDGALKLAVDGTADRSASYHSAGSTSLKDAVAKEIGFTELAVTPETAFQLRLTGTSNPKDNGFTTLVWAPAYNNVTANAKPVVRADMQKGQWFSTRDIAGAVGRVPTTLAEIVKGNPNAKVEHYGVSIGTGSAKTSALVDNVKFNGCATNFAKKDAETGTGSLSSLGNIFGS